MTLAQQTVFIVDDDEAAAASVGALLISLGYHIETYLSAEDFLAKFDSRRKGCLLLDIRLGGMSGIELQDELLKRGHTLPIIVVSGHCDNDMFNRIIAKGAVACFTKPFAVDDLCNTLKTVLSE